MELERLRTRAAARRAGAWLEERAGKVKCYGSLSALITLPIGSGIGQIPEPNPAAVNLLRDSRFSGVVQVWSLGFAAGVTPLTAAELWNAGFNAQVMTAANGNADFVLNNSAAALAAKPYTAQFEVSGDLRFPTLAAAVQGVSPQCQLAVAFSGGVARTDSITLNPANGNIVASSAGVTNITVSQFTVEQANGTPAVVYRVSFTTPNTPAGTNAAAYKIFPRSDTANAGAAGAIVTGAWQLEQSTFATSFISTGFNAASNNRPLGVTPRHNVDRGLQPRTFSAFIGLTYQQGVDNGCTFEFLAGSATSSLTFPALTAANDGEWAWVVNNSGGIVSLATSGAQNFAGIAGVVNTFNLPFNGLNALLVQFSSALAAGVGGWQILASAASSSTGLPASPVNSVQFNSAGVFGGSANLTWSGTALVLNGLLDISGASGGQISFPATQNPSAGANVLDDYEEGTFTPTVTFGGAAVSLTFSFRVGNYTKIGNCVTIEESWQLTAKGSSVGTAAVGGLPFAAQNTVNVNHGVAGYLNNFTVGVGQDENAILLPNGTTYAPNSLIGGVATAYTDASFQNTSAVAHNFHYYV